MKATIPFIPLQQWLEGKLPINIYPLENGSCVLEGTGREVLEALDMLGCLGSEECVIEISNG